MPYPSDGTPPKWNVPVRLVKKICLWRNWHVMCCHRQGKIIRTTFIHKSVIVSTNSILFHNLGERLCTDVRWPKTDFNQISPQTRKAVCWALGVIRMKTMQPIICRHVTFSQELLCVPVGVGVIFSDYMKVGKLEHLLWRKDVSRFPSGRAPHHARCMSTTRGWCDGKMCTVHDKNQTLVIVITAQIDPIHGTMSVLYFVSGPWTGSHVLDSAVSFSDEEDRRFFCFKRYASSFSFVLPPIGANVPVIRILRSFNTRAPSLSYLFSVSWNFVFIWSGVSRSERGK